MTGCSGFANGVSSLGGRMDPKLVLWGDAMRGGGYSSWYVGKWMNDGKPITRGYDETLGLYASGGGRWPLSYATDWHGVPVTGYRGWVFQHDDGTKLPEKGVGLVPDISREFADAAIEFINRGSDKPFFLHVNFTAPHDPLLMPPELRGDVRSPGDAASTQFFATASVRSRKSRGPRRATAPLAANAGDGSCGSGRLLCRDFAHG